LDSKLSILLLSLFLLLLPVALAPTAVEFSDPGTTPDSFWYPVERWWERAFETTVDHTPERFAEMQAMLTAGNTLAASRAGEEVRQTITFLQERIEEGTLEDVLTHQERIFEYEQYLQEIRESGAPPAAVEDINDALTETGTLIGMREGEIAEEMATEQGISYLDAEAEIERAEQESFGDELQLRVTVEGLAELRTSLEEAQVELAEAATEGRDIPQDQAVGTLLEEATEKVLQAETAFDAGQIGRADGLSTAAEHLIYNAGRFLDDEVRAEEEVEEQEERVIDLADRIQERDKVRNQRLIEVIELSEGLASFPPKQREQMIQAAKTFQLQQQRQQVQEEMRAQLREEGKSNEEIARTLMEDFAREYEHIYGEMYYLPPIATEPEVADERWWLVAAEEAAERLQEAPGGVVEDITYRDPVTDYTYEFTDEGYTFVTPLGLEHEVDDLDIVDALHKVDNPFETGAEVVSKVIETAEGRIEYRYTATGYEIRQSDGDIETVAYDVGKYELPGGGLIEVQPYGFEVVKEGGERTTYEYHPNHNIYVSTDGYVVVPPEGLAIHQGITYDYGEGNFKFEQPGGIWKYDSATRVWKEERAAVGTSVVYEGITYIVTAEKGWTNAETGDAVPPPPGQLSSDVGSTGILYYRQLTEPAAPVGTVVTYAGQTYIVDPGLGWSVDGKAVPPPPGQPSSAVGSTGGFAKVGTTAFVDGKNYIVDLKKGWMEVESGRAVPPPPGYSSSAVGMKLGDSGIGAERNYNYVEDGKAYYFPPGVNPRIVDDKSAYKINDPRGYDPAFGTDFGSGFTYTNREEQGGNYGHIRDSASGQWRPATREEAEQAQLEGKGGGLNPTYSPSDSPGAARNYNYVEEGKAYYFPPGINPGTITDKSSYVVGDPRGYDPAFGTDYGSGTTGGVSGSGGSTTGGYTGSTYGHVYEAATGGWRQATAEEAAAGGPNYSPPGGTSTSGWENAVEGTSYSSGGYTSGYTAPESGPHEGTSSSTDSGAGSSGGYSSGDSGGGSTSSGGDSGGSTGGSTGDTGSSTGGIIAQNSGQESGWSPLTRWIYKYLGLKIN